MRHATDLPLGQEVEENVQCSMKAWYGKSRRGDLPMETLFKLKSWKIILPIPYTSFAQSVWNFAQNSDVQYFKTIQQLNWISWTHYVLQDLS